MNPDAKFWEKAADRYAAKPVADQASYQRKLQVTRTYFRLDMNVLEIACGTGSTAIAHAPCVKHIHATDISSRMIEIAQDKAAAEKVDNVSFEQAAIDDLRVPDRSLDAVLGLSILHLLENKEDAIAKIYRMLKPGGVFVSSTACLGGKMGFLKFIIPIGRFFGLMPLVKIFSVQELQDSLTDAGFRIDHEWQQEDSRTVFIVAKKAV